MSTARDESISVNSNNHQSYLSIFSISGSICGVFNMIIGTVVNAVVGPDHIMNSDDDDDDDDDTHFKAGLKIIRNDAASSRKDGNDSLSEDNEEFSGGNDDDLQSEDSIVNVSNSIAATPIDVPEIELYMENSKAADPLDN
jgi:hypothetical protein